LLSGVSPLVAVSYQIMVMCMMFGGAGISTGCYLWYLLGLVRAAHQISAEPDTDQDGYQCCNHG